MEPTVMAQRPDPFPEMRAANGWSKIAPNEPGWAVAVSLDLKHVYSGEPQIIKLEERKGSLVYLSDYDGHGSWEEVDWKNYHYWISLDVPQCVSAIPDTELIAEVQRRKLAIPDVELIAEVQRRKLAMPGALAQ